MRIHHIVLIGNSLGGAVAMRQAENNSDIAAF